MAKLILFGSLLLTLGVLYGPVKKCRDVSERQIPLLASPRRSASAIARSLKKGGVAERSIKCREACADRREAQARQRAASIEVGVVFRLRTKRKPPRLRQLRWLREILLMTQPPLLFKGCALSRLRFAAVMQGGECASPKRCDIFFHSGHDLRSPQSMKMFLFCPLRWHSGRLDLHFLSSYDRPGFSCAKPPRRHQQGYIKGRGNEVKSKLKVCYPGVLSFAYSSAN
jgi:hypothetical protein